MRFTALLHHVYDVSQLRTAFLALKKDAAAGVDGETWQHYRETLEMNLQDLSERLKRGAYRAKPVRRVYIPKADGRQRPLGVPVLEDKIVQRATVEVLNTIYETDFLGFSYGFRPRRSQHHALDALYVGLPTKKVGWVLDVDIRAFFDTIDHGWLRTFVEHRIADRRIVRLIQKWLNAGVLEEGTRRRVEEGTPQGGSVSPLLANIYLHYVFDLWTHAWRQKHARGNVMVVRYADDIVLGFQVKSDAERFRTALAERFAKFQLELHPEKTHLLEFGAYAAERRRARGQRKPETFNFLGFTHICGKKRNGQSTVLRHTMRQRLQAKLHEVKAELRRRKHRPVCEQGAWLRRVVGGHIRYYGVPTNDAALYTFRFQVARLWFRTLRQRSQRHRLPWARMRGHVDRWLPPARVCHPYPFQRVWRHNLRQEPDAGNPLVRICGGGCAVMGIPTPTAVCANHIIWGFQHVAGFRRRHVGTTIQDAWAHSLAGVRQALDADTSADRAMVLRAATTPLAATRDDVIQTVTTRLELPRKSAAEAYDLAEAYEGNPRSVWGYVQGLTRLSQRTPWQDGRFVLDRAASRLLTTVH